MPWREDEKGREEEQEEEQEQEQEHDDDDDDEVEGGVTEEGEMQMVRIDLRIPIVCAINTTARPFHCTS